MFVWTIFEARSALNDSSCWFENLDAFVILWLFSRISLVFVEVRRWNWSAKTSQVTAVIEQQRASVIGPDEGNAVSEDDDNHVYDDRIGLQTKRRMHQPKFHVWVENKDREKPAAGAKHIPNVEVDATIYILKMKKNFNLNKR